MIVGRISYADYDNDYLKYAYQDAIGWNIEIADNSVNMNDPSSLALSSGGNPHISYEDFPFSGLKYATKNGVWSIEYVDNTVGVLANSLALDSGDNPHIAYYDEDNKNLKYAYKNGGGWNIETVDGATTRVGMMLGMALDSSDNPHIVYSDHTNNLVKYATKSGGVWSFETIEAWAGSVLTPRIFVVIDSSDFPHAVYPLRTAPGAHNLRYAYKNGGGWTIETVTNARVPGLALDSDGFPHVSYFTDTTFDLGYAYKDGGGWNLEIVDSAGVTGYNSSLALDGSNNPYISYYDLSNEVLRYAYNIGLGWVLATVDNTDDVGDLSSLALGVLVLAQARTYYLLA